MSEIQVMNDQLLLIGGLSGDGKSSSLRNILNQEKWIYLNCDAGKRLPFRHKFMHGGLTIEEPAQVYEAFDYAYEHEEVAGVAVDTLTFLMDLAELFLVQRSSDSQKGWGQFQQYFKVLMMEKVARLRKPVIFLAHVREELDEAAQAWKTSVPVKGALKNNGIEAYFSTVVTAKKVKLKDIEKFGSKLLNITDEEKELGFKHVFQTRITKETTGCRIRSPMGMFDRSQTYIDNDAQLLLNHLNEYYGVTR